jgi:hypothetical protein
LLLRDKALGVAAPDTAQGAALDEDHRAYTRPIVHAEPLDVEYGAFNVWIVLTAHSPLSA